MSVRAGLSPPHTGAEFPGPKEAPALEITWFWDLKKRFWLLPSLREFWQQDRGDVAL